MLMNSMRKIIAACAALVGVAFSAPTIWDGSADISWYESSAQAYNLTTAEQLAGLAKLVNEGISNFSGKTITLGADIFLNDTAGVGAGTWASVPHTEWTPIGTKSRPFKGEFDGIAGKKNRKIYGLYISDATKNYAGLFGYTSGVNISNLDVLVGRITANDTVGALIGYATSGSITNVRCEVQVTGNNYVGGLVGNFTGRLSTSFAKENVVGRDFVGGLIGWTKGSVFGTSQFDIYFVGNVAGRNYVGGVVGSGESVSKSYAKGSVKGDSNYVGGVIGYASGSIDSVYHIGGDVRGHGYVGGVVGQVSSSVTNSYSEGGVMGTGNYVGGLIGLSCFNYTSSSNNIIWTALNTYAIGDVKGEGYVGGLVGLDSINRSWSNREKLIKKIRDSYSVGNVVGNDKYVGGILGKFNYGNSNRSNNASSFKENVYLEILSSHHKNGHISGDSSYVGGIVGYVSGKVDSSYHIDGDVNGDSYVGGLAGLLSGASHSYSKGNVKGVGNYVGGLIGLASGSVNNSNSEGSVKGDSSYVGGVIGYAGGSIDSVRHVGGEVRGYGYVGGLVGKASSFVKKSYSEGKVTGLSNYVGGLIGYSDYGFGIGRYEQSVDSSNHIGDVSGSSFVGGLIGEAYFYIESCGPNAMSLVMNSYSEGNVTGAGNYVGGLIGMSYFYRDYCGAGGRNRVDFDSIMTVLNTHAIGNVVGASYVGGLIGLDSVFWSISYYGGSGGGMKTIISNSYSDGNVVGHDKYVGGVLGKFAYDSYCEDEGTDYCLTNSLHLSQQIVSSYHKNGHVSSNSSYVGGVAGYATGKIDSSYHINGDVNGDSYVGGLAGRSLSDISNSYSEGNVIGIGNYVGGLIGLVDETRYFVPSPYNPYNKVRIAFDCASIKSSNHTGGDVKGSSYVGGLIGKSFYNVSNSYSEGNVTGTGSYIGGLLGELVGEGSSSVTNSYSKGNVTGMGYVGGVIGSDSIYCNIENVIKTIINDSYSIGNVVGKDKYVGGVLGKSVIVDSAKSNCPTEILSSYHKDGFVSSDSGYVGGFAGFTMSSINNSYAEAAYIEGQNYVGGLVGYSSYWSYDRRTYYNSSISNSHAETVYIKGQNYVGGLVGNSSLVKNSYAKASLVKGQNLVGGLVGDAHDKINYSYFEGDSVMGVYQVGGLAGYSGHVLSSYSTAHVKGDDNVGGLIGSARGNVSNSYALGNVIGDTVNSSAGNDNLGGLVGYQYGDSVSKSMALGNVSGTTKLGGLIGRFDGKIISQSYANGNVTGSYYGDPADEVGNYYIGGLVGYAKGSLEETYASGVVWGIKNEPVYTGCIVGFVKDSLSVSKSYYDKTKCSLGVDGGEKTATVIGTPDKTTTEMKTQSTFEDWDFVDTWKIVENTYPFLQIYSNSLLFAEVATTSLEGIEYDGKNKTPQVTSVTFFGDTLENSKYKVTYKDNINVGTASIRVCGVKPYSGCKVVKFEIAGLSIKPTIAAIDNMTYTGVALTPEIKVYNGDTLLSAGDYVVEYKNNVNVGTATVSVTMKGNYSGSASKTFTIKKATPVISQSPKAGDVISGQTLETSEFSGGLASTEGEFVWKTPTTKPALKNDGYAVVFVPSDTKNYTNSAEIVVPVKVLDFVYVAVHFGKTTIDSVALEKGSNYTLPKAPDSIGHDFVGFYKGSTAVGNSGDKITVSTNTVIDTKYKVKTYVITFMNDTTKLQSSEVAYGVVPTAPKVKLPANTAQRMYTFVGWNKDVVAVTGDATYMAVIDSAFRIVFKNHDGTVLRDSMFAFGSTDQSIKPTSPKRDSTAKYAYTFKDWSPTVIDVKNAATYTAVFDSTVRSYTITFMNGNTKLQVVDVEYGKMPQYTGKTPTKSSNNKYSYTFAGWSPKIASVKGGAIYQAVFDSTKQTELIETRFVSSGLSVRALARSIQISAAPVGSIYAIADLQGRVLKKGFVESADFNIAMPQAGIYLVRIGEELRKVSIR